MARKFSVEEKQYLRAKLQAAGRELFAGRGLKKTGISDLTSAVGIAQGTFYLFYPSKEELYLEIIEQEEFGIQQELLRRAEARGPLTRERFRQLMADGIALLEHHPFFRQMYEEETMELLLRKLTPEMRERLINRDSDVFAPLIAQWQEQKRMRNLDPELVLSVLRALVLLTFQRKLIGEQYPAAMALLLECIANGLIPEEDRHDH